MRLKQEIVLGIGGWRLLRALGLQPEVCHLTKDMQPSPLREGTILHGGS